MLHWAIKEPWGWSYDPTSCLAMSLWRLCSSLGCHNESIINQSVSQSTINHITTFCTWTLLWRHKLWFIIVILLYFTFFLKKNSHIHQHDKIHWINLRQINVPDTVLLSTSHAQLSSNQEGMHYVFLGSLSNTVSMGHIFIYLRCVDFAWTDLTSLSVRLPVSRPHVLIKHRFHFNFFFSANQMPSCFLGARGHADDCFHIGVAVVMPTLF